MFARGTSQLILALLVGGCVETGDFGRVKRSVGNDLVFATGTASAFGRGEAVSLNLLTDDEEEMRERSWRFLVPGRDRPWLDRLLGELVATRLLPPDLIPPDRHAYFDGLLGDAGRSPASLYRRLSEDAAADAALVGPFTAVAARVLAADRKRLRVLAAASEVTAGDAAGAQARVAENRCLVAWVTAASTFRVSSYRFALEHLVIEAPQVDAVPTERAIARLAAERSRLDGLHVPPLAALACLGGDLAAVPLPIPSDAPPLVRKG